MEGDDRAGEVADDQAVGEGDPTGEVADEDDPAEGDEEARDQGGEAATEDGGDAGEVKIRKRLIDCELKGIKKTFK